MFSASFLLTISCDKQDAEFTSESIRSEGRYLNDATFKNYLNSLAITQQDTALLNYFNYLKEKNNGIDNSSEVKFTEANNEKVALNRLELANLSPQNRLTASVGNVDWEDYNIGYPRIEVDFSRTHMIDWALVTHTMGWYRVVSSETLSTNRKWITELRHNGSMLETTRFAIPVSWTESYTTSHVTKQVATMAVNGTLSFGFSAASLSRSISGGIAMNAIHWAEDPVL